MEKFSLGEIPQHPLNQGTRILTLSVSSGHIYLEFEIQHPNIRATGDEIQTSAPTSQSESAAVAYKVKVVSFTLCHY